MFGVHGRPELLFEPIG